MKIDKDIEDLSIRFEEKYQNKEDSILDETTFIVENLEPETGEFESEFNEFKPQIISNI